MIAAAVAMMLLIGPSTPPAGSVAHDRPVPCSHIAWRDRGPDAVARLIRCATRRWTVPGGYEKALAVARCESGLRPHVRGGTGDAHYGVYQQRDIYWLDRWRKWGRPLGVPRSPFNALSNVVVSIRQASEVGWGPWSCA